MNDLSVDNVQQAISNQPRMHAMMMSCKGYEENGFFDPFQDLPFNRLFRQLFNNGCNNGCAIPQSYDLPQRNL